MKNKICKKCNEIINANDYICPQCGARQGIPLLIIIIIILGLVLLNFNSRESNIKTNKSIIKIIDFSNMSQKSINEWCNNNKINCVIKNEYSNEIKKDSFISQSIDKNINIYEGEEVVIVFSLGIEPSIEYQNALKKAESYSKTMYMSKQAIYDQLVSSYGEHFEEDAAKYAIDNLNVDFKDNALKTAENYQKNLNMSKEEIYNQLVSRNGEKFTLEEAEYAINKLK